MQIHDIKGNPSNKARLRVGRGPASGSGKTAGRGHKGYHSRSGATIFLYREGGQMPIVRRMPKRGFSNKSFATRPETVNVGQLARFAADTEVTPEVLKKARLIRRVHRDGVKILGQGDLAVKLTVKAHAFSESARKKIEAAGGTVVELPRGPQPKAQAEEGTAV